MSRITPILDSHISFDPLLFPAVRAAPEKAARLLGASTLPSQIDVPVWCYLIDASRGPGLIDAGSGGLFGGPHGRVRTELAKHGQAPADIRRIWLTHLHGDHCGGLLAEDGEPAFPNARIALPRAEQAFWLARDHQGVEAAIAKDARAVLAPYVSVTDLVAPGETVDFAKAVSAPGHTPGHMAWLFEDQSALAAGDIFHLPELQLRHPDWSTDWDTDALLAAETRKALCLNAKKSGLHLLTGHGGRLDSAALP